MTRRTLLVPLLAAAFILAPSQLDRHATSGDIVLSDTGRLPATYLGGHGRSNDTRGRFA